MNIGKNEIKKNKDFDDFLKILENLEEDGDHVAFGM